MLDKHGGTVEPKREEEEDDEEDLASAEGGPPLGPPGTSADGGSAKGGKTGSVKSGGSAGGAEQSAEQSVGSVGAGELLSGQGSVAGGSSVKEGASVTGSAGGASTGAEGVAPLFYSSSGEGSAKRSARGGSAQGSDRAYVGGVPDKASSAGSVKKVASSSGLSGDASGGSAKKAASGSAGKKSSSRSAGSESYNKFEDPNRQLTELEANYHVAQRVLKGRQAGDPLYAHLVVELRRALEDRWSYRPVKHLKAPPPPPLSAEEAELVERAIREDPANATLSEMELKAQINAAVNPEPEDLDDDVTESVSDLPRENFSETKVFEAMDTWIPRTAAKLKWDDLFLEIYVALLGTSTTHGVHRPVDVELDSLTLMLEGRFSPACHPDLYTNEDLLVHFARHCLFVHGIESTFFPPAGREGFLENLNNDPDRQTSAFQEFDARIKRILKRKKQAEFRRRKEALEKEKREQRALVEGMRGLGKEGGEDGVQSGTPTGRVL